MYVLDCVDIKKNDRICQRMCRIHDLTTVGRFVCSKSKHSDKHEFKAVLRHLTFFTVSFMNGYFDFTSVFMRISKLWFWSLIIINVTNGFQLTIILREKRSNAGLLVRGLFSNFIMYKSIILVAGGVKMGRFL